MTLHPPVTLLLLLLLPPLGAAPVRILAIGDSLTEEYAFEFPFSSPAEGQPDNHARNWPEQLAAERPEQATLGTYQDELGSYSDFRDGGFRLNFGIPGYATENWIRVLSTDSYNPFEDPIEDLGFFRTREALIDNLPLADVAVIFLGGNDLKNDYNDLFNDTEAAGFFSGIENRLEAIHAFIRQRRPALPVVVATAPDVGATPEIYLSYTDPQRVASTRAKIAAFNQQLTATFEAKNATAVARIDRLTDRVHEALASGTFAINGTEFTIPGDPQNPPDHVFCHDNFHPNTAAQSLVTNELITAINQLGLGPIDPLPNREILAELLYLDPDQPYLDFIAGHSVTDDAPEADPDGDGVPNLVEMAFGSSPAVADRPWSGNWEPGGTVTWTPDPAADGYLSLEPRESPDLESWSEVPPERRSVEGEIHQILPPEDEARHFLRFEAVPQP